MEVIVLADIEWIESILESCRNRLVKLQKDMGRVVAKVQEKVLIAADTLRLHAESMPLRQKIVLLSRVTLAERYMIPVRIDVTGDVKDTRAAVRTRRLTRTLIRRVVQYAVNKAAILKNRELLAKSARSQNQHH